MTEGWQKTMAQAYEKLKAQVRAKVEHPFHKVKNLFHYKKTRCKGIKIQGHQKEVAPQI